ncbi:polysaccharide lyase family 7 protein [Changchengzhania lutea]|uniref:polysaccharide lyase family 7 protein n=1 Tax=Changchengzhania lutea TaxID=2049305 RepID=UPI00115E90E3|nr:polysaccharide lyase family 7 protein [Changchengzhania lutea]
MVSIKSFFLAMMAFAIMFGCSSNNTDEENKIILEEELGEEGPEETEEVAYKLPNIDLNNWKVTLPIGNPTEVKPPEILNYGTNGILKPFFYNDSINGALVFYTYPGASTANSSYSRTELREQMVPGSNNTNWTFKQGGNMKGKLQMGDVSKDTDNKYHRTIIMQIHGRLTNAQRDLIGQADNNAPPILKLYWTYGKVRVTTKILKNLNASDTEILYTDAWGDAEGYTFEEYVGFDPFTLEIKAAEGRMEVILNDKENKVYDDIHIQKWGVFENYFKAGNYLVTKDEGAFSTVKYYNLEVKH